MIPPATSSRGRTLTLLAASNMLGKRMGTLFRV